jgi:FkbM family methyltransferase
LDLGEPVSTGPLKPDLEGFPDDLRRRIELTIACHDTDSIPKVEEAGAIRVVDGVDVQVMHNGILVEKDSYQGAWMTEVIRCLHGFHEPQEELVFQRIIERIEATETQPSMIELGSWWSYYSLWFQHALPSGRVTLLEPDPAFLEAGRRNFELNGMTGSFVHGAVGGAAGTTAQFETESTGSVQDVTQHDLLSLMTVGELETVTLVLADIQGAEAGLIERSRTLLSSRRVRFMVVSTHHHAISGDHLTHQKVLAVLQELGAHVIAEHSIGESFSGDGLVAVSFDPRDRDLVVDVSRARHRDSMFGELEYELAASRAGFENELEASTSRLRETEAHIKRLESDLDALRAQVAAMQQTRLWRWAAAPRAAYERMRRTPRGGD